MNTERMRMQEQAAGKSDWRKWGPYLSERQWGTVREDYSANGDAWRSFPHDHARSRAYRWGEDGLAGISDKDQRLCFAFAFWNGRDPILKERLFGVPNGGGNHGEDVKELYYYLDALPSHSYLKFLYKYPQRQFPYGILEQQSRARGKPEREFELWDTDAFADDRYFDLFVEYAKGDPTDIHIRLTAINRGPQPAPLQVLSTLWYRNTWAWKNGLKPRIEGVPGQGLVAVHEALGAYRLHLDATVAPVEWLFTDNETNIRRLYGRQRPGPFKDAFHEYVIEGSRTALRTQPHGTKAAGRQTVLIPPGGTATFRARLTTARHDRDRDPFVLTDAVFADRLREADEFYADLQEGLTDPDARSVQRQAFAGMVWSKQFYHYDVREWLQGDPCFPPPPDNRRRGRNSDWEHLRNHDVISMPDKWEYPWYAAWDLAFHCLPFALLDAEFAKEQILLMTREWYMHPNGQLPAYEWNFGDVNPPVHAWAAWRVFQIDRKRQGGTGDVGFLERVFHKLLLNFTWWVNRKDVEGRNIFQGGFLGLDNIGLFDRSAPLPFGGHLDQADATSWMAMYSLNLLRISLELALHNPAYEDVASKFFEHFLHIARAITRIGGHGEGLWDEPDRFYYDHLHLPNGAVVPLKVRSMVGLIPLFAVETLEPETLNRLPDFHRRLKWFLEHRPDLAGLVSKWYEPGRGERRLLSLLGGSRMKRLLQRMLDETEFLSDHGIRALSRYHRDHPFRLDFAGTNLEVRYEPGESQSDMFGGNSNWRGPVWFPVNYLLIESLQKFHHYYGDDFKVECPTGSGKYLTILQIADELARRLCRIFLRDEHGKRAVYGSNKLFQDDPHFRDHVLFYEYFHGDTGEGLGASHQTGWTGLVAKLLQPRAPD